MSESGTERTLRFPEHPHRLGVNPGLAGCHRAQELVPGCEIPPSSLLTENG